MSIDPDTDAGPQTLRRLFDELVELAPPARALRLAQLELSDDLRAQLQALLRAEASRTPLLDQPVVAAIESLRDAQDYAESLVGSTIGPFRLLGLIGEGGSSIVFRAQRAAGTGVQSVALKLMRTGLFSAEGQRRFRREQAILAQLTHPNIAHLIEAGITEAGIPYIAMELVDGLPITDYAAQHAFGVRQRLACFVTLCRAVEAAHAVLIVHRDLKPSNVLVDRQGQVKILDFGIAKLLHDDGDDAQTRTQSLALTPEYAAPEQFRPGPVTIATDVYALGVLLGELLTGLRPNARAARGMSSRAASPARHPTPRGLPEGEALPRSLRGDLDAIVATAVAEEPERRFRSASALADDIERHLRGQPVEAHPPTRWYRTRKFVQRHRGGVLVTAVFAVGLVASLGVALWQAGIARQQAARAQEQAQVAQSEARRANAVRDFVQGLFEPVREGVAERNVPSVQELVAVGVQRLDADATLGPAERVDLLMMFARLHDDLGESARARELGIAADELAGRELDPGHPAAIGALALRGIQAVRSGDHGAGEAPLREALRRSQAAGRDDPSLIAILDNLAVVEMDYGHADAALALEREALAERIRRYGPDAKATAAGYNNLGFGLVGIGRYDEAAEAYRRTYEIDLKHRQPDSYQVLTSLSNWGGALANAGKVRRARELIGQADEGLARLGGRPRSAHVMNSQKLCLLDIAFSDPETAGQSCARMLAVTREHTGGKGLHMGNSLLIEASRLIESGALAAATDRLDQVEALQSDGDEHMRGRGRVLYARALIAWLHGDPVAARRAAQRAEPLLAEFADAGRTLLNLRALLLLACRASPDPDCPPATLEDDLSAALADNRHPGSFLSRVMLARLQIGRGEPAAALARIDAAVALAMGEMDVRHPLFATAGVWRAHALAESGRCDDARRERRAALAQAAAANRPNHPWLLEAANTPLPNCPARK